jgi:anti-sigma factor RsiW
VKQRTESEELIIRYLTGDLSERSRQKVEDRYFKDDSFFEEVAIVEEELIDDYVRGRLTGHVREQFEKHFLTSPARRERVEFSRTMLKSLTGEPISDEPFPVMHLTDDPARRKSRSWFRSLFSGQNRTFQLAAVATMLLIAAGAVWLLLENRRLRDEINDLQAACTTLEQKEKEMARQVEGQRERERELEAQVETEQNGRRQLEQQLDQLLAQSQPQPPTIFELTSNSTRSTGATKSLSIPSSAKTATLRLYIEPGDYSTYRAVLETAEGEKVWSKSGLKASATSSGKAVVVNLPAALLSSRDYVLMLGGANAGGDYDDVGAYSFRVVKK